ncbi:nucleotidyltransferase [Pantoea sp. B65]
MAGSAYGLLPLTASLHQACLMLGKYPMIDYQLGTFERAGIGHKTFVLGHGAAECARILFESLHHSHFVLLNNPLHHALNLDWSAWLVLSKHDGPVIYYESDLLLPPSVLKEVKNHPAEICIVMDSARPYAAANIMMRTPQQNNKSPAGRAFPPERTPGEFIPVVKLGAAARHFVVEQLAAQSYEGEVQLYNIFSHACSLFPTAWIDTAGRPWARVDNRQQLQRASELAEEILSS